MDRSSLSWTPDALRDISQSLEGQSPEAVLRWGLEQFHLPQQTLRVSETLRVSGSEQSRQTLKVSETFRVSGPQPERNGIALATGFGPEGVVLMHMVSRLAPDVSVFYTDTDLLFEETYALRDALSARLGLSFTRVHSGLSLEAQAAEHGPALWSRDPDQCCQLRKVAPLRQFLRTRAAWVTAIRRDQTANRAAAGLVEWDRSNGLVKLNPLAAWTTSQVWSYVLKHELPYNPLHDQGYPSIGCWPCTKAVTAGADPRSGRWAGQPKTECGIHLPAPQMAS